MAWFGNDDREKDEIRKKSQEFEAKYAEKGAEAPAQEAGIEEGDWMDYIMPVRSGIKAAAGKGFLRTMAKEVPRKGAKAATNKATERVLDYGKINREEMAKGQARLGESGAGTISYDKSGNVTRTPGSREMLSSEEFFARQAKKGK